VAALGGGYVGVTGAAGSALTVEVHCS